MKQLDQATIQTMGIPSLVLMERAALAVFDCLKQHFSLKKTLIVCGSGNNGADGMAVARLLHLAGYSVDLYLAGNPASFTEEMKIQWQAAENYQVSIVNNCRFSEYTTIVDALFGVGLSRELPGKYQTLVDAINASGVPVLAVDIPSGIHAGTGQVMGTAVRAAETVTFAYRKLGISLYPGTVYAGNVQVKDVGIYGASEGIYALDKEAISWLPARDPGGNKGTFGKVLLIAGSRNMIDAVQWAQGLKGSETIAKDVEKGKKQFVGPELRGKTLGVIGLGAIGARVANAAVALGMEVLGYDPYISIDAAWSLSRSVQHCVTLGDMLPRCDYLTIHVPYLPSTKNTINAQTLAMCKDGVRVLNFARGELVDNFALLDALGTGKVAQYFCDFPAEELLGVKGVYCTPHLGASTPESETNCAVMAANELSDYLKNGNITHSVNMPDVSQPRVGGKRICIIHRNEPGAISAITGILTAANLNIENMVNKGRKNVAYTMLDVTGNVDAGLTAQLSGIDAAIRVRIL